MPALSKARDLLLVFAVAHLLAAITALLILTRLLSRLRHPAGASAPKPIETSTASIIVAIGKPGGSQERCLGAVLEAVRLDGQAHEIIVVGDGAVRVDPPPYEAPVRVRSLSFERASAADVWLRAVESASRDVVVLLDDDTIVDPTFLRPLIDGFKDPFTFAVAPRANRWDGNTPAPQPGRGRGALRHGRLRWWSVPWTEGEVGPEPTLWAARSGCAYHRTRFLELGGFDSLYGDELADLDLCFRAWRHGWQVLSTGRSLVRRRNPASSSARSPRGDLAERDSILFHWGNLDSFGESIRSQVALIAGFLVAAREGQLNLRPLRYSAASLPRLLVRRLRYGCEASTSVETALRISSHPYHLRHHRTRGSRRDPRDERTETPASGSRLEAPDAHQVAPARPLRLLQVLPHLPYPPVHGGAVRMWNELKVLAARHQVDILSFHEPDMDPGQLRVAIARMEELGNRVRVVARRPLPTAPDLLERIVHMEMFDCPEMHEALLDMVDSCRYDAILYHKTEMGFYALPRPAPMQILVEHIVFHLAYRRQFLRRGRSWFPRTIEYLGLRRHELDRCRSFDCVLTMSATDARFLRARLPSHPCILESPNGVDTGYYRFNPDRPRGNDLLFIGSFDHSPNVDGIRFFLSTVYPLVKAAIPDVRLFIVGPGPYGSLPEVAAESSAIATGLVEDIRPFMQQCAVFVAPILAGSGTRLKILEAMSAGIPVVSTTVGAEGIEAVAGTHLLIADNPPEFAASVLRLLQEDDLRRRVQINARALVETRYDWQIIGAGLESVLYRLLPRDV